MVLPNGKVFLLETDGSAILVDNDGTPVWTGSLTYRSSNPADIVLYNEKGKEIKSEDLTLSKVGTSA